MSSKKVTEEQTFEKAMDKLESIVEHMEAGELPLEEIVSKYEDGMQLIDFCSDKLDAASKKIELLTRDKSGNVSVSSLNESDVEQDNEI